jgi:hypothetical protein
MQIRLLNETDLHYKVIEYIRLYHPDALIVAGLGEYQDSGTRRKDAFYKGYTGGCNIVNKLIVVLLPWRAAGSETKTFWRQWIGFY